jgi:hypothetical protein
MPSILRLIGFLSAAFTLAITVLMLFEFRKERRIDSVSLVLSAAVTLLLFVVFVLLSGARLNLMLGLPILTVGLVIGFLRGMTTRLFYKDGQVMGRNSLLFLLGWGGSLAIAQLLSTFGSALLASIGLLPLFLSTGARAVTRPPDPVMIFHLSPSLLKTKGSLFEAITRRSLFFSFIIFSQSLQ